MFLGESALALSNALHRRAPPTKIKETLCQSSQPFITAGSVTRKFRPKQSTAAPAASLALKRGFTRAKKQSANSTTLIRRTRSFSGDKLNTLIGLVINAMQHGIIYVGTGVLPAFSHPESMGSVQGPGPEVQNRLGSFMGPMSASFQVEPPNAPPPGDIAIAEAYGARVAQITLKLKG